MISEEEISSALEASTTAYEDTRTGPTTDRVRVSEMYGFIRALEYVLEENTPPTFVSYYSEKNNYDDGDN